MVDKSVNRMAPRWLIRGGYANRCAAAYRSALIMALLLAGATLVSAQIAAVSAQIAALKIQEDSAMPIQEKPRIHAPELSGGHGWLNTDKPLSLAALKGKVVLLDFWTYGCINCM